MSGGRFLDCEKRFSFTSAWFPSFFGFFGKMPTLQDITGAARQLVNDLRQHGMLGFRACLQRYT